MSDRAIPTHETTPFTDWLREYADEDKIAGDLLGDMDDDTAVRGRDLSADELYDHVAAHNPHPEALAVIRRAARAGGYPFNRRE
ncbi:hypothetical protein [Nocardioides sp. Soil805]|uniref:hypothetical protein n=1 Tax=Nocardioides sp. Soil805 TaxID=1736416 RepID=UPI000702B05F|nr:hypothetical protein [Nocardioides sp. Soil805]KRF37410.1 hypothetical protein ASG94_08795 [Nocardioides sp. Soil805]